MQAQAAGQQGLRLLMVAISGGQFFILPPLNNIGIFK
jgi:hypothetical protein